MSNLANIVEQLKKEHARAVKEVKGLAAAIAAFTGAYGQTSSRRKMSAAGRARIAAAQKARWAKVKGTKKRTMSAAARKKIAAAQKARWAKVKAAKAA